MRDPEQEQEQVEPSQSPYPKHQIDEARQRRLSLHFPDSVQRRNLRSSWSTSVDRILVPEPSQHKLIEFLALSVRLDSVALDAIKAIISDPG